MFYRIHSKITAVYRLYRTVSLVFTLGFIRYRFSTLSSCSRRQKIDSPLVSVFMLPGQHVPASSHFPTVFPEGFCSPKQDPYPYVPDSKKSHSQSNSSVRLESPRSPVHEHFKDVPHVTPLWRTQLQARSFRIVCYIVAEFNV